MFVWTTTRPVKQKTYSSRPSSSHAKSSEKRRNRRTTIQWSGGQKMPWIWTKRRFGMKLGMGMMQEMEIIPTKLTWMRTLKFQDQAMNQHFELMACLVGWVHAKVISLHYWLAMLRGLNFCSCRVSSMSSMQYVYCTIRCLYKMLTYWVLCRHLSSGKCIVALHDFRICFKRYYVG